MIDKSGQCIRRIVQFIFIWLDLVVIKVNNHGLFDLQMDGVNFVSVKSDRLMGVCLNTMLMPLTAVIVLRIQMHMRRCPLNHHKGGKHNVNQCCGNTLLDHGSIEFKLGIGAVALVV